MELCKKSENQIRSLALEQLHKLKKADDEWRDIKNTMNILKEMSNDLHLEVNEYKHEIKFLNVN